MRPLIEERERRRLAGAMSGAPGRGGQRAVPGGTKEVEARAGPSDRVRCDGGGRPRLIAVDSSFLQKLDKGLTWGRTMEASMEHG